MRKALCDGARVAQVADTPFPVSATLVWRDCADDVKADGYLWNGASFVAIQPFPLADLSNMDNLDKVLKAVGLVIADVSGRTPAQIKALFATKYNAL